MTRPRTPRRGAAVLGTAVAVCAAVLAGCSPAAQVEGVKFTSGPSPSTQGLQPTEAGGLAVRLDPPQLFVDAGQPATLVLSYADAHGGLIGTVEDYGDGGVGGLKLTDCHESEANPSSGTTSLHHVWQTPGAYTVSVTVTTLSCTQGQEDVTATARVTVR